MLAILGPTASGKSALALGVARHLRGTIVNGDPYQAYAGIPIGTGQPITGEQAEIPHRGYGDLPLTVTLNPGDFGLRVRSELCNCAHPVLVTGSGLYLRGIWQQMDELPEVPAEVTERVRAWGEALGAPVLHRYLASVDPRRAFELHPNDRSRIQRALALHLATGRRPSELLSGVPKGLPEGWRAILVLPSRERQRERVALRVRSMIDQGWIEEVRMAMEQGYEAALRRIRPLGYVDWMDALKQSGDFAATEARIIASTQAYAKRQATWFRNQLPELPCWDPDTESLERAIEKLAAIPLA
jgi:tRNA dimethylallyltransferase